MDTIRSTTPHFVRCLKPNHSNAPDSFDRHAVVNQLRYSGVLEAARVSRLGVFSSMIIVMDWHDTIVVSVCVSVALIAR
jgi:myosin heavy subunit